MTWLKAFGWLPAPVFYTDMIEPWGGKQILFLILIHPKYRDDAGIHQHELEHVEQAWKLALIGHSLAYLLSRKYRLWAEVQAYRRQIAVYGTGAAIEFAVNALVNKYDLQITETEARELLTNPTGSSA